MPERRCFILGAGFSRCCGLPLASELTHLICSACKKTLDARKPCVMLGDPRNAGQIVELSGYELIRMLFPRHDCDFERPKSWPDFEQLLTMLDEYSQYLLAWECVVGGPVPNPADLMRSDFLTSLPIELNELTKKASPEGMRTIRSFVESLDLTTDAVISFNWDVLIEIVAEDSGIDARYTDECGQWLRLAKPHGSLNVVDMTAAQYDTFPGAVNAFPLKVQGSYDGAEHVVLRAQDPRDSYRQLWPGDRVLVEPNVRKAYTSPWLSLQWTQALRTARDADRLIVIGFSLPATDLRPRLLLQLAQVKRSTPPHLTIVDPDPDDRLCGHYHTLTGLAGELFKGTLEEYVRSKMANDAG